MAAKIAGVSVMTSSSRTRTGTRILGFRVLKLKGSVFIIVVNEWLSSWRRICEAREQAPLAQ